MVSFLASRVEMGVMDHLRNVPYSVRATVSSTLSSSDSCSPTFWQNVPLDATVRCLRCARRERGILNQCTTSYIRVYGGYGSAPTTEEEDLRNGSKGSI